MKIIDYTTAGGKNVIIEYIDKLPENEKARIYRARQKIMDEGKEALEALTTRPLKGKIWEIKLDANRIMYVLADSENIYFLHAFKKQKNKTEKFELEKAVNRAKEFGLKVD